jgi:hypothetical protein
MKRKDGLNRSHFTLVKEDGTSGQTAPMTNHKRS